MAQFLDDLTREIETLEKKRSELESVISTDLKTVPSDRLSVVVRDREIAINEVSKLDTILAEMRTRLGELELAQKREQLEAEKRDLQAAAEKFQEAIPGWSKKLSLGRQYLQLLQEFAIEAERFHGVNYRLAGIERQLNDPELQEVPASGYIQPPVQLDLKIGKFKNISIPMLDQESDGWVLRLHKVSEGQE